MSRKHPCFRWLHAIPNGGKRGKREAAILKREGVTSGIPDLFLPFPQIDSQGKVVYCGLYLEIKTPNDNLSTSQRAFKAYCTKAGYKFIECRTAQQGISALLEYVGDRP